MLKYFRSELKEQVIDYCMHRENLSISNDEMLLMAFVRHCGRKSLTEVTKDDINNFHDRVAASSTQYNSIRAMKALRCLFRYHKVRGTCCIDPKCITDTGVHAIFSVNCDIIPLDMANRNDTRPKVDRNRDLVIKRIRDPRKWSWGALGDYFGIARPTAYTAFKMHATKYVTPNDIQKYESLLKDLKLS